MVAVYFGFAGSDGAAQALQFRPTGKGRDAGRSASLGADVGGLNRLRK